MSKNFQVEQLHHSHERGDTIIEVLIAMAVLSLVLVSAMGVARNSANMLQSNREQQIASGILRSQAEMLRQRAGSEANKTQGVFAFNASNGGPRFFCMVNATTFRAFNAAVTAVPTDDTAYPPECRNIQGMYNVAITYDSSARNTFALRVTWPKIGGDFNQQTIFYRLETN